MKKGTTVASVRRKLAAGGLTVGVDLGDQESTVCVLDGAAEVIFEGVVKSTRKGMMRWFRGVGASRVVMEAGTHSPWCSRLVEELGHEVVVTNPRQLRLISGSVRKDDTTDAKTLAQVGRLDRELLRPVRHRGEQAQADLELVKSRGLLVSERTRGINHVRGAVKAYGERLPKCSAEAFPRRWRG